MLSLREIRKTQNVSALAHDFFSVLLALIIESGACASPHNPFQRCSNIMRNRRRTDSMPGKQKHGILAWLVVVLPWTLAVGLIYYVLYRINFARAFLWNVVIVYFTLGFRQFSHLLHRHPSRAQQRRRSRAPAKCSPSGRASTPSTCR